MLSLTVIGASTGHIQIEIALPEAAIVKFRHGFDAWCEAAGATGIEPTAVVHDIGSGQ
jgi:hypothetical protein